MIKCEICKYQKDCPDIVEENSVYCLTHRKIPKNFDNEYIEKQQLIVFLENKINHLENIIYKSKIKPYGEELHLLENSLNRYKEVLDFANKGNK